MSGIKKPILVVELKSPTEKGVITIKGESTFFDRYVAMDGGENMVLIPYENIAVMAYPKEVENENR